MTKLRTLSKIAAAATVIGVATLSAGPASAASNDWHRVSTDTLSRFSSQHHSRTGTSYIIDNNGGYYVAGAAAYVCWGGGHVGVQTSSHDYVADGRGVRAQIRYRVAVNGHWSGYHYRNLAINTGGKGHSTFSYTYSANHGTTDVVVRAEIFDHHGHITAVGPWR